MRGIILAGGTGSRLPPITVGVSEQVLPRGTAWRRGFIDDARLAEHAHRLATSGYGAYLQRLLMIGER